MFKKYSVNVSPESIDSKAMSFGFYLVSRLIPFTLTFLDSTERTTAGGASWIFEKANPRTSIRKHAKDEGSNKYKWSWTLWTPGTEFDIRRDYLWDSTKVFWSNNQEPDPGAWADKQGERKRRTTHRIGRIGN